MPKCSLQLYHSNIPAIQFLKKIKQHLIHFMLRAIFNIVYLMPEAEMITYVTAAVNSIVTEKRQSGKKSFLTLDTP